MGSQRCVAKLVLLSMTQSDIWCSIVSLSSLSLPPRRAESGSLHSVAIPPFVAIPLTLTTAKQIYLFLFLFYFNRISLDRSNNLNRHNPCYFYFQPPTSNNSRRKTTCFEDAASTQQVNDNKFFIKANWTQDRPLPILNLPNIGFFKSFQAFKETCVIRIIWMNEWMTALSFIQRSQPTLQIHKSKASKLPSFQFQFCKTRISRCKILNSNCEVI